MEIVSKYFPGLSHEQHQKFDKLQEIYAHWNKQINVISRKDMDALPVRHILHSLSIAKFVDFTPDVNVLDVGTGGGFPGIPLALFFPDTHFTLVDSIGKKIKVVNAICEDIGLQNVTAIHKRAEEVKGEFHFVVTRAVASLTKLQPWVRKKMSRQNVIPINNGIIALKGGDLEVELMPFKERVKTIPIADYFDEPFFETKKIVYLPANYE